MVIQLLHADAAEGAMDSPGWSLYLATSAYGGGIAPSHRCAALRGEKQHIRYSSTAKTQRLRDDCEASEAFTLRRIGSRDTLPHAA